MIKKKWVIILKMLWMYSECNVYNINTWNIIEINKWSNLRGDKKLQNTRVISQKTTWFPFII